MNTSVSDKHIQGPQIHQFNNVQRSPIPRSSFKRDHTRRTTFNSNDLVPIFVDEILPGDDVHVGVSAQVRMTTPIKPIMDNLYLETFWFFVPMRLVWSNWEAFQGQVDVSGGFPAAKTIPVLDKTKAPMSTTGFTGNSIYDHLGLPTLVTSLAGVSCLFNRAYDLCYQEWFADESIDPVLTIQTGDGPDDPGIYNLKKRRKRKDYFTSCLPWTQKAPNVSVSLGSTAPLTSHNILAVPHTLNTNSNLMRYAATDAAMTSDVPASDATGRLYGTVSTQPAYWDPNGRLYLDPAAVVDLSGASAITINALRQAALYQQIYELDARAGTRYVESLYSRFGVISPDFRLQRPELCGQGQTRINVFSVPQTQATGASGTTTPQGNLSAFSATPIQGGHSCRYSATEHGILLGIANVRADLTYQQGLPKMFSRSTRFDFYEPLLNGLGEQAVLNQEIYAQGTGADTGVFGYQERFSELRFKNSEITGVMRSNDPQTLQVWHLSQNFGSLPALNTSFIAESVPMDRILAVATSVAPNFIGDFYFGYNHVRPMPIRSNPGIDRL